MKTRMDRHRRYRNKGIRTECAKIANNLKRKLTHLFEKKNSATAFNLCPSILLLKSVSFWRELPYGYMGVLRNR